MKFYLVGYMGCGKSTIGRKVARRLGIPFYDTDSMVEQAVGASVADIITFEGEERFRRYEREALEQTASLKRAVISTGGGLPVWGDNMLRLQEFGRAIYIRRSAEHIIERLSPYGRQRRPKLRGLSDKELLEFMRENMADRDPVYRTADFIFDADIASDDTIVEGIADIIREYL